MRVLHDSRVANDLDVVPLSAHEWRISDSSKDERDGLALLGFVEANGEGFDVTVLGRPKERIHVQSFSAAIDVLVAPSR